MANEAKLGLVPNRATGEITEGQIEEVRRGHHVRKPPDHFDNFICDNIQTTSSISFVSPQQKGSSDMRYPLKNYVTSTRFSAAHEQCLAVITKVAELRYFHEAVKDEN